MKRWYGAFSILALTAAVSGTLLVVTAVSGASLRAGLGQGLALAAFIALVGASALRGTAEKEEAVGKVSGEKAVGEAVRCTFSDVAANKEALDSLMQLKDYLKYPEKYARRGARMPRGILLYGPPGTGKTLLARALAGEAEVPFFAMSGSDFVEKYVGVSAGRVRELFRRARKAGRCVIFIDEIDALGKRRSDNSSDERDQTLNALLSEMSGFRGSEGIVVIAATNRAEMLDPALTRPGRFDRLIEVGLPGRAERLSILKLHSANKPLDGDISLEALAARTVSFSGALLENLLNEAAIAASLRDDGPIRAEDIEKAFHNSLAGTEKPVVASDEELCLIAAHEAGHALVSRVLNPGCRIERVSVHPAGHGAAGYNLCVPEERVLMSRRDLRNRICVLLAGRAAEQAVFGEDAITSGASGDLERAAEIAVAMVSELGMQGHAAVSCSAIARRTGGSAGTQERCEALLDELYGQTLNLLGRYGGALRALMDALIRKEALNGREVSEILDGALSNGCQESA